MIGTGVLKGMGVVLKEFLGTYPPGRWLLRAAGRHTDGLFTISYPDVKQEHAERFRYYPFLVYDGTPDNLRCVACRICEQECPPQCIHIIMAKDEKGSPVKAHGRTLPAKFDIDTSICMSCRICVDVCPFDAIEMDNEYELSAAERKPMNYTKERLLKSNEYFRKIRPIEAAEVDRRLQAKKAKDVKPAAPGTPATPQEPPKPSGDTP